MDVYTNFMSNIPKNIKATYLFLLQNNVYPIFHNAQPKRNAHQLQSRARPLAAVPSTFFN